MAIGRRKKERQATFRVETSTLPSAPGHLFYTKLDAVLEQHGFAEFVEGAFAPYYAEERGRPSIPSSVYFKMLLIGYFAGSDSERGRRCWKGEDKKYACHCVFANRRRIRGAHGKALLRRQTGIGKPRTLQDARQGLQTTFSGLVTACKKVLNQLYGFYPAIGAGWQSCHPLAQAA